MAFATANQAHAAVQTEKIGLDYLKTGTAVVKIEPFLSAKHIRVRLQILKALNGYSTKIASLTNGDAEEKLGNSVKGLSKELQGLEIDGKPFLSGVSPSAIDAGEKAIHNIGKFIIQAKLNKGLPSIIEDQHKNIVSIAKLLNEDMHNLKGQLENSRKQYLQTRDGFIAEALKQQKMTATELRIEVEHMLAKQASYKAVDASMDAAAKSMDKLVTAHENLRRAANPKDLDVDLTISQFKNAADEIREIYKLIKVISEG